MIDIPEDANDAALRHMAQSCATRQPRDLAAQAILLRSARTPAEKVQIQGLLLEARAYWLTWLTIGQRNWQTKISRRASRARHHDSLATREKYVRAGG